MRIGPSISPRSSRLFLSPGLMCNVQQGEGELQHSTEDGLNRGKKGRVKIPSEQNNTDS